MRILFDDLSEQPRSPSQSMAHGVGQGTFFVLIVGAACLVMGVGLAPPKWQPTLFGILWLLLGFTGGIAAFLVAVSLSHSQFEALLGKLSRALAPEELDSTLSASSTATSKTKNPIDRARYVMSDSNNPEIYRIGSQLISMAHKIIYAIAGLGVCCAVGSNFVESGAFSVGLLSLGWFAIGFAFAALVLFAIANTLVDHDADDESPIPKETRPAG